MDVKQIMDAIKHGDRSISFPLENSNGYISDANGRKLMDVNDLGTHHVSYDGDTYKEVNTADWLVDGLNAEARKQSMITYIDVGRKTYPI